MGNFSNLSVSVPVTVPQWQKVTVAFGAVQVAALTKQVTIYTLPAKSVLHAAYGNVTTAFSGGAIVTITGSVGTAGSPLKYAAVSTVGGVVALPGLTVVLAPESMSGTTAIVVQFISTIANLSALTQGSIDIYLLISSLE